ncbi:MAG: XRE family transcriptional regulator [Actinobacteria bacterium]|jgi:transcriptional regulator with XRE-family HTH domain|nr:XRE family transcriptional regulator [Actinomycetota bacterium]NDA38997.1 XRE family transcriptional regulator [Actinomycetota bacterium]NDE12593.1 XRE family transcriptional regulator [Actinomycetota bacterium]NDE83660.1 XRE family transcriptional regulator [Actinomycetota bacterium]
MANTYKKGSRVSAQESADWLRKRMQDKGISGLGELSEKTGIDRGSLSRYFRQERTPGIDVIAPLCEVLEVSPETLLIALGALSRRGK